MRPKRNGSRPQPHHTIQEIVMKPPSSSIHDTSRGVRVSTMGRPSSRGPRGDSRELSRGRDAKARESRRDQHHDSERHRGHSRPRHHSGERRPSRSREHQRSASLSRRSSSEYERRRQSSRPRSSYGDGHRRSSSQSRNSSRSRTNMSSVNLDKVDSILSQLSPKSTHSTIDRRSSTGTPSRHSDNRRESSLSRHISGTNLHRRSSEGNSYKSALSDANSRVSDILDKISNLKSTQQHQQERHDSKFRTVTSGGRSCDASRLSVDNYSFFHSNKEWRECKEAKGDMFNSSVTLSTDASSGVFSNAEDNVEVKQAVASESHVFLHYVKLVDAQEIRANITPLAFFFIQSDPSLYHLKMIMRRHSHFQPSAFPSLNRSSLSKLINPRCQSSQLQH